MSDLYPAGQHPLWCELGATCTKPSDPQHLGRTSILYGQSGEARAKLQLVRIDGSVPAGTRPGSTSIALTLTNLTGLGSDGKPIGADAHLSIDEAQALQLVLAQYVDFARREDGVRKTHTMVAEDILAEAPA